jgi:hypothetical protein
MDPSQAEGDGGGGGGAGGVIVMNAASFTGAIAAEAKGAKGSDASNRVNDCTGPGGGGGGGIVWTAGTIFPAAVTAVVTGGASGIVSLGNTKTSCQGSNNGALAGVDGGARFNYAMPVSIGTTCVVLGLSEIKDFKAEPSGADVLLSWELSSTDEDVNIRDFVIQRSTDAVRFTGIALLPLVKDSSLYRYADVAVSLQGALYYRLAWQHNDGSWSYSRIVAVNLGPGPASFSFHLQPNPASQHMTITVISTEEENATVAIANAQGKLIQSFRALLHKGANVLPVDLRTLAPSTYFIIMDEGGRRLVKPFIKTGQ